MNYNSVLDRPKSTEISQCAIENRKEATLAAAEIIKVYFSLKEIFPPETHEVSPIVNPEILDLENIGVEVRQLVRMYANSKKPELIESICANTTFIKSIGRVQEKMNAGKDITDWIRFRVNLKGRYENKSYMVTDILKSIQIIVGESQQAAFKSIKYTVKRSGYSDFKIKIEVGGIGLEIQVNTQECSIAGDIEHQKYKKSRRVGESFTTNDLSNYDKMLFANNQNFDPKTFLRYLDFFAFEGVSPTLQELESYDLSITIYRLFVHIIQKQEYVNNANINEFINLAKESKQVYAGTQPIVETVDDANEVIERVNAELDSSSFLLVRPAVNIRNLRKVSASFVKPVVCRPVLAMHETK